MIVPISQGASSFANVPDQMPSQTNLLMALATMHKQGRFDKKKKDPQEEAYG